MRKCVFAVVLLVVLLRMPILCCAEGESRDFTVMYYVGDEISETRTYAEGSLIFAPMIVCDEGYAVTSWKTASGEIYDFSSPISESFDLYADVSLLPAVATVDRLSFTYDEKAHELKISSVYHPLEYSGGYYKFEWYRDGIMVSERDFVDVKNVSDSGEYSLKITFFFGEDSSSITYDAIAVNVYPKSIIPPVVDDVIHKPGALVTPNVEHSPYYTYDTVFVKGPGSYFVELTLTDKENYRWADQDGESVLVGFNVVENQNYVEVGGDTLGEYTENKSISVGAVLFLFSFLLASFALILIIVARKNTHPLSASASMPHTKNAYGIDDADRFDDESHLSIQLLEDDTDDIEYRELSRTDALRADCLISDSMAKNMIKIIKGTPADAVGIRACVSIGEISNNFYSNERVDIQSLKDRKMIDTDVGFVKITEEGEIDKPLKVYANDFTLSAVKMIVLTGGETFRYQGKRF